MTQINPQIEGRWKEVLQQEFEASYFQQLKNFLLEEKEINTVYPPGNQIFAAFNHTPFNKVKVVILGQDPYHGAGQAEGLCFSVPEGIRQPPSLVNIFKEISDDLGYPLPQSGNLTPWARQGVFLLNATLTVRATKQDHIKRKVGEQFTDTVITTLSEKRKNIVFMLWGNFAQAKETLINTNDHYILKAAHPSPLSAYRGFFGCKHFSKANEILSNLGLKEIDWEIE